jgi:hypothetical protein
VFVSQQEVAFRSQQEVAFVNELNQSGLVGVYLALLPRSITSIYCLDLLPRSIASLCGSLTSLLPRTRRQ